MEFDRNFWIVGVGGIAIAVLLFFIEPIRDSLLSRPEPPAQAAAPAKPALVKPAPAPPPFPQTLAKTLRTYCDQEGLPRPRFVFQFYREGDQLIQVERRRRDKLLGADEWSPPRRDRMFAFIEDPKQNVIWYSAAEGDQRRGLRIGENDGARLILFTDCQGTEQVNACRRLPLVVCQQFPYEN